MSRLFFVPQLPTIMRYQRWWYEEIRGQMKNYFDEVITLGHSVSHKLASLAHEGMFSPVKLAINFECNQVADFQNYDIRDDDVLFLADLSFPGIFANTLYHKRVKNAYAFCHASAVNAHDYYQPVRKDKWALEKAHGRLFRKVFVGSNYHWNKLRYKGWRNNNLALLRLPIPSFRRYTCLEKEHDVISVSRPCLQKVNKKLEKRVEERLGLKIIRSHEELKDNTSWDKYYQFIGRANAMLISSKEETFGYQVIDAVMNDCIPIAPNGKSYPELLSRDYLYDNLDECVEKLQNAICGLLPPQIIPQRHTECLHFYERLGHFLTGRECAI